MNFADLKKQSKSGSLAKKLSEKLEKMNSKSGSSDERFFKLTVDKAGNGSARIRFLPRTATCEEPFVRLYSHSIKGPGGFYIKNCPTTIDKPCPACAANRALWAAGDESTAKDRKRKLNYISNIYVINDPGNPENNGKVFLFKYGKKIMDIIEAAKKEPEFKDDDPAIEDPFDLWQGANFTLRAVHNGSFRNYDSSSFSKQTPLIVVEENEEENDKALNEIWESQYDLNQFIAEDQFEDYDALEERLTVVLGEAPPSAPSTPKATKKAPAPKKAEPLQESEEEEDDDMDYFNNLVNQDDED